MAILEQRNGADTELLVFTMTLINKVLGDAGGGQGVPAMPRWRGEGLGVGHAGSQQRPILVLLRRWQPCRTRTPSTT